MQNPAVNSYSSKPITQNAFQQIKSGENCQLMDVSDKRGRIYHVSWVNGAPQVNRDAAQLDKGVAWFFNALADFFVRLGNGFITHRAKNIEKSLITLVTEHKNLVDQLKRTNELVSKGAEETCSAIRDHQAAMSSNQFIVSDIRNDPKTLATGIGTKHLQAIQLQQQVLQTKLKTLLEAVKSNNYDELAVIHIGLINNQLSRLAHESRLQINREKALFDLISCVSDVRLFNALKLRLETQNKQFSELVGQLKVATDQNSIQQNAKLYQSIEALQTNHEAMQTWLTDLTPSANQKSQKTLIPIGVTAGIVQTLITPPKFSDTLDKESEKNVLIRRYHQLTQPLITQLADPQINIETLKATEKVLATETSMFKTQTALINQIAECINRCPAQEEPTGIISLIYTQESATPDYHIQQLKNLKTKLLSNDIADYKTILKEAENRMAAVNMSVAISKILNQVAPEDQHYSGIQKLQQYRKQCNQLIIDEQTFNSIKALTNRIALGNNISRYLREKVTPDSRMFGESPYTEEGQAHKYSLETMKKICYVTGPQDSDIFSDPAVDFVQTEIDKAILYCEANGNPGAQFQEITYFLAEQHVKSLNKENAAARSQRYSVPENKLTYEQLKEEQREQKLSDLNTELTETKQIALRAMQSTLARGAAAEQTEAKTVNFVADTENFLEAAQDLHDSFLLFGATHRKVPGFMES